MSQRSNRDSSNSTSKSRQDLDFRRLNSGVDGSRNPSFTEELLSDGAIRPPSPGLPLHRDTGMSNLELHDTAAGVSSRRRGQTNGAGVGSSSVHTTLAQDDTDYNEKDYLMDRRSSEDAGISTASTSKGTPYSNKEKEKWSKLIPEDLLGGSSSTRSRRPGARQHRSGFRGVVSCIVIYRFR
jgi:hypothetical protein